MSAGRQFLPQSMRDRVVASLLGVAAVVVWSVAWIELAVAGV